MSQATRSHLRRLNTKITLLNKKKENVSSLFFVFICRIYAAISFYFYCLIDLINHDEFHLILAVHLPSMAVDA